MHRKNYYNPILELVSGTMEYAIVALGMGSYLHLDDAAGYKWWPDVAHVPVEGTCSERPAAGTSWSVAPWLQRNNWSEASPR